MANEARLNKAARKVDELAPNEPLVVRLVYKDTVTGEEELWGTYTILAPGNVLVERARRQPEVQLTWGDEDND